MSSDILAVLEYMEKEKGITRADMISAIASAIRTAGEKGETAGQHIQVDINPRTGSLKAWVELVVVDSLSDPKTEIPLEKARRYLENPQLGDIVKKELDPSELGRIAAQTVRQTINQRIRQFEKERIFDDFKGQIGDIVTGVVRRWDRGTLIVDLGKAEAIMPARERIQTEDYAPGERVRALLLNIETTARGPEIILSRASPLFVRKLFELEVGELHDGTVAIKAFAREPGYRTKIAVDAQDPKVDPVGACVGARGGRVKGIVRELAGEKVDVIRYFSQPKAMLEEAIRPAIPRNIRINEAERRIYFEVAESDISLVLGSRGRNAKLISQLMGWRLDITKEMKENSGFEARLQKAVEGISHIKGIEDDLAQRLVAIGITTPDAFEGVTAADLEGAGFSKDEADHILEKVEQFHREKNQRKL